MSITKNIVLIPFILALVVTGCAVTSNKVSITSNGDDTYLFAKNNNIYVFDMNNDKLKRIASIKESDIINEPDFPILTSDGNNLYYTQLDNVKKL